MSHDDERAVEYFYNTRTKMVEKGRQSSWEHLMGPYDSAEEAQRAVDTAAERNREWDEDDDEWEGEES